jgi:hypothetical protein
MLGETLPTKQKYPVGCMAAFLGKLYPIMKRETSVSVFLYQVSKSEGEVKVCWLLFISVRGVRVRSRIWYGMGLAQKNGSFFFLTSHARS